MASPKSRAWRALALTLGAVVLGYVVMGVIGVWTPQLGLDLRGGTSITLTARPTSGQGAVTKEKLQEAVRIINSRVNGTGITEATVTTQGDNHILVQVPGVGEEEIVKLVGQTAQLRFRQVLAIAPPAGQRPEESKPTKSPESTKSPEPTKAGKEKGTGPENRGRGAGLLSGQDNGAGGGKAGDRGGEGQGKASGKGDPPEVSQRPASREQLQALQKFHCRDYKRSEDRPDQALITCDRPGKTAFVLGPALMLGTDVKDATAGVPQNSVSWQVNLKLKDSGDEKFGQATTTMYQLQRPLNQFAIVLDGKVVSAPRVQGAITNGVASITGDFTQVEAQNLANVLKYGALPLAFEPSQVSNVSPTLGSDSLRGGLLAGIIGLGLVVCYSIFYYRALGLVAVSSLALAAAITYPAVVLLGVGQGFTLTLAGIAGLIVAVGITADSFVIYFERLRDEVREGKGIRSAMESGWVRARRTLLAADSISFLAAVVLYALSVGGVRGFAYALGLSTLVDVAVVFFFTRPLMDLVARTKFFGQGHRLSGLSPDRLGVSRERFAPRAPRGAGASGRRETREA